MKLLFFIKTLKGGGAERVLVNLTNELVKRGHDITIALNENATNYDIDSRIKIHAAEQRRWYQGRNILKRLSRNKVMNHFYFLHTKEVINKVQPDVIITFLHCNMKSIIKCHGCIPIVHSEHNAYDRVLNRKGRHERFHLNRLYDKVCVLTPFDMGYAKAKGLTNVVVMPNPNTFMPMSEDEYDRCFFNRRNILSCGRVNDWKIKGFDIAIKMFATIANQIPKTDLDIVGPTDEKSVEVLTLLASKLNVADRVHFLGQRSDIRELMCQHKLLLLPSRTEGFPMVVTEAMTQGLPCVAFEKLASSIIVDDIDGVLVENDNIEGMERAVLDLLNDNKKRYRFGKEGINNVTRFSSYRIADRWDQLFQEILNDR